MSAHKVPGPVAFQGAPGANSDLACRAVLPGRPTLPCRTFEDAFDAVREGRAAYGMIPIENSLAGRVADIHLLLPDAGLKIVGEHFQPIHHCLLALKGVDVAQLRRVHSHPQALGQCRARLRAMGLEAVVNDDTAAAAEMVAALGDPSQGALASSLAAEIYGLDILHPNMEDAAHNMTRFIVVAREAEPLDEAAADLAVTSFVFDVRNIPAALYKALGGFATNGVNMSKLESYMVGGTFTATRFYAEVEAPPHDAALARAMDELGYFASAVTVLGVYPAATERFTRRLS